MDGAQNVVSTLPCMKWSLMQGHLILTAPIDIFSVIDSGWVLPRGHMESQRTPRAHNEKAGMPPRFFAQPHKTSSLDRPVPTTLSLVGVSMIINQPKSQMFTGHRTPVLTHNMLPLLHHSRPLHANEVYFFLANRLCSLSRMYYMTSHR